MRGFFYFVVITFFFSCSSDNSGSDDTMEDFPMGISAQIGEITFERDNAGVSILDDVLTITASIPEDDQLIVLRIQDLAEGTFQFGPSVNNFVHMARYRDANDTYLADLNGGSGQLTITDLDLENLVISGTFEFTALSDDNTSIAITSGVIDNLDIDTLTISDPTNNTFSADINTIPHRSDIITLGPAGFPNDFMIIQSLNNVTGQEIIILFQEDLVPGTYMFSSDADVRGNYLFFREGELIPSSFDAVSGTLIISTYDQSTGSIEGSFSFTAEDTTDPNSEVFEITNGNFSIQPD